MLDFRDRLPTSEEYDEAFEQLDEIREKLGLFRFNLNSTSEIADHQNREEAARLYRRADNVLSQAQDSVSTGRAYIEWANSQMHAPFIPEMTALLEDTKPPVASIRPVAHFWEYGPVFEVQEMPLEGSSDPTWHIFINETERLNGRMEVVVIATFGSERHAHMKRAIPIAPGRDFAPDTPEFKWTAAQWAEFAKPQVEEFIAAFKVVGRQGLEIEENKRYADMIAGRWTTDDYGEEE